MRVVIYDDTGQIAYIPFPTWTASTGWWQVAKIVLADGSDPEIIVKGRLFAEANEAHGSWAWDTCGADALCWDD